MDLPIRPINKPSKTKEFKEWDAVGRPTFKHFKSEEERLEYLKWIEEHKHELPF